MQRDSETDNPMNPSQAHDTAYDRTPEHDQMVVEVYEYIKMRGLPYRPVYTPAGGGHQEYENSWVECEKMYVGRRTFFADIGVVKWSNHKGGRLTPSKYSHHLILEIKPKIYSVGAVIRQVKAQQHLINGWCEALGDRGGLGSTTSWGKAAPVLAANDPLLDLFSRAVEHGFTYFVWDGVKLVKPSAATFVPLDPETGEVFEHGEAA
ncbi:hypothetical protein [Pseudaminobacter sp. NGMCC 1.201702]|uniref:hypothetical protein n=1 Tax=Pseudaminobacter sp. NGMCC 1.201702 TaxID=3391825 RepID=UPI0039EF58ED